MAERTFVNAIGWNFVGSIVRIVATLVCQVFLLRILGPEPAGHFALFLFVVGIGSILSEGGMSIVIARATEINSELLRGAQFLIACYAGAITILLIGCTYVFLDLFKLSREDWYIPVTAALNVLPLALTSVPIGVLKRQHRARDIQIVQVASYILCFGGLALSLTYVTRTVIVLISAFSAQTMMNLILCVAVSKSPVIPRWKGAGKLRRASSRALLVNAAGYINESLPNVAIAHILGPAAVGLYSTSFNLLRTPTDVISNSLHGPLLISSARRDEALNLKERYLSTLNLLVVSVFAGFVVVYFCGPQITQFILGGKWISAGPVLSIVALIMTARVLGTVSGAVIWGGGRLRHDFLAQVIGAIILLGGLVIFSPRTTEAVAWIVLASATMRTAVQILAAARSISLTYSELFESLVTPAVTTVTFVAPLYWFSSEKGEHLVLSSMSWLVFAGTGLVLGRMAVAVWLSPRLWAKIARDKFRRIRFGSKNGKAELYEIGSSEQPERKPTI